MTNTVSAPSIKDVLSFKNSVDPAFSVIFLLLESKVPAVSWKTVIDGQPFTDEELRDQHARFKGRLNPAMAMGRFCAGGLVAVDLDNAQAVAWAEANLPPTRMKTITRAGQHWFYRLPGGAGGERVPNMADVLGSKKRWEHEAETKLKLKVVAKQRRGQSAEEFAQAVEAAKLARAKAEAVLELGPVIDVRGDGGQVVAPGAIHPSGFVYRMAEPWTQELVDSIPDYDPAWFEGKRWRKPGAGGPVSLDSLKAKRVEERIEAARSASTAEEALKRAAAWIEKADPSISGQGGHNQAFYVACRLVCGFNLDIDAAYHLMKNAWNDGCQPPWSDEELAHKVVDAEKQRGQNDGFMLVDRPEFLARKKIVEHQEMTPQTARQELDDDAELAEALDAEEADESEEQGPGAEPTTAKTGAGHGAPPPSPPAGGGGGGGKRLPRNDEERMWQKRWAALGVDYVNDVVDAKRVWSPKQVQGGVWQIPPWTNNIAIVIECSRFLRNDIRHNELKMFNEINGERMDDGHVLRTKSALDDLFQCDIAKDKVDNALELVASKNRYEPVQEWLLGLPAWDGVTRLEDVPKNLLGSTDEAVQGVMFRHTMIGLIARIMEPGTKVDHITFLVGPQGAGKSKFWRLLMDGHLRGDQWFTDAPFNLNDKDGRMLIGTNVLVEWSEGEHAKSALKIDRVKGFLSQQEDEFRPPYKKHVVSRKRRCVFVGTSNDDELLHDATGSRRFYIIKTKADVDLDSMLAIREQLFAEALALYQGFMASAPGTPAYEAGRWWFTATEDKVRAAAVAEFQARSPWFEDIEPWVEERARSDQPEFTLSQVIEHCVKMDRDKKSKRVEAEVRHTLVALGCQAPDGRTTVGGRRARWWQPPSAPGPDDDLPM